MPVTLVPLLVTGGNSGLQVIFLFVLFAIIIGAAYYVTYYISKLQQGRKRNSNLQIIEAISVGPQKTIQIIKTGNKYIVVGVTKGKIEHLITLSEDEITINNDSFGQGNIPFKQIFEKYKKGENGDSGENRHESKDQ
jgi:flagellar protein FliO/FliZ